MQKKSEFDFQALPLNVWFLYEFALKQLRELKELKDADVLDSTQFEAQKKILLTELNGLHCTLLLFVAVLNLLLFCYTL